MSNSWRPHGLYGPWNCLGKNTGVGSLSLLQGITPTKGLNSSLLYCRQILYQLSHKGSPTVMYVYLKITQYAKLCNKIHKIMEEIRLGINIQTVWQWHAEKKEKIRDDTKSESVGCSISQV